MRNDICYSHQCHEGKFSHEGYDTQKCTEVLDSVFQEGNSFIHRADPRVKLVSGLIIAFLIAFLKSVQASAVGFCTAFLSVLTFSLPLRRVLKTLLLANVFIAFLWLFLPFSVKGKALIHVWKLTLTLQGIRFAFLITLKCNAILMMIMVFIATIPIPTLGYALSSLGLSQRLTLILLMSYRYINVIFEEYRRLTQSLKVRCFKPCTNLHTYKTYAYLIAMVFTRSYERGVRVYQAMLLRGFNGRFYSLRKFEMKNSDVLLFIGILLFGTCLIMLDRGVFI